MRTAARAFWTTEMRAMCVHGSWGAYVLGGATRGGVELVGGGGPRTGPSGYRAGSPSPWVRLASYVGPDHHGDPITRRSCADHARRACTRGHTDGRSAGEIGGWHRLEAARSGFRARFCRFEARAEGAAYRLGVALRRADPGVGPLSAAIDATLRKSHAHPLLENDMLESPLPDSALPLLGYR